MNKIYLMFLTLFLSVTVLLSAQNLEQQIGQDGDAAWSSLLSSLKSNNQLIDPPLSAKTIANNFRSYEGKSMLFPSFSFDDFVTDRDGVKYFYYGEQNSYNYFVIKYNDEITELLRKYSYAIGPVGNENWELLGTITEVYGWWGDIVRMDIQAVRVAGKATVKITGNDLEFVSEDLIDQIMEQKAEAGLGDVPKNLQSIPTGLDARTIADLYFQIGSVERNEDVWMELLGSDNFYNGKPERRVSSWWDSLGKENRTFFFVRVATDTDTHKKYFYQIRDNGNDVGSPKPVNLDLENGEWKVRSGL